MPGFIAYLRGSPPKDAAGKLDAFDEIFQRFVDETSRVEAAGETGPLANAAYNRSMNAADEILQAYFAETTPSFVAQLHESFGTADTPPIDMSKVTVAQAASGGGCAVAAMPLILVLGLLAVLIV